MVFLYLLSFVLGIVALFILVSKWTEGELSGMELIGSLIVTLILIALVLVSPTRSARLLASGMIIVSFVVMTAENRIRGAIITRQMAQEELDQASKAAEANPRNAGARFAIAKSLYQLGRVDAAIEHMQAALELPGDRHEEKSVLQGWIEDRDSRLGVGEVFCPNCQTRNRRGARVCRKCESWLRTSDEILDWLKRGALKQILRAWIVAAAALTAVVIALSFFSQIGIVLVSVLAGAVFLIWFLVHLHMEW